MKKLLLTALLLMFVCTAQADMYTLTFPQETKIIAEKAFYDDWGLVNAILPEGLQSIGAKAFAESALMQIDLPGDVDIAADAFEGVRRLTVNTVSGSKTAAFATQYIDLLLRTYSAGTYTVGE